MDKTAQWFQQRLSPRLDALEVVRNALTASEPDAGATARRLARSLREPAASYGFEEIAFAAEEVENCSDVTLLTHVEHLIRILRVEAGRAERIASSVLIVGGDPDFVNRLAPQLAAQDRQVIPVGTAAEAQRLLREQNVVLIALNMVLPDLDGRVLLHRLRENPLTASIPVLVLAPRLSDSIKHEDLALSADGVMEQPLDEDEVVGWIKTRLRRARETIREARRDQLTGLLNRAAFRETYAETQRLCLASEVPLALAVVSVDNYRETVERHGEASGAEIVRRVGLLLSASLRVTDVIGRLDTAQFAAMFPSEDQFGGARAVEKVIGKASAVRHESAAGRPVQITLSAGVTVVTGKKAIEEALAEAERFLFQAASAGGNRVVSTQSDAPRQLKRVLVAVGDDLTSRVLSLLLEKEGLAATLMTDGPAALAEATGENLYHLIVVDETLRAPDGFQVLERIRSAPRLNRTPVLMLLAKNSEEGMVRALEMGASDYLARPFAPLTLMAHVRRLISRGAVAQFSGSEMPVVLVVSDSTRDLLVAGTSLRERGRFRTYLGIGGEDGVKRFEEIAPDVLILDFDMADMKGTAFLDAVAASGGPRKTAVIAATREREPQGGESLAARGVKGVVRKPFEALTLALDVERILGIPENAKRAADASDHLNAEILRVMRSSREAAERGGRKKGA